MYAAAIGALGQQDYNQWSKNLLEAEIQRTLDVVHRADPSAVVNGKGGRLDLSQQGAAGAQQPQAQTSAPAVMQLPADAQKLAPGTPYQTPDGSAFWTMTDATQWPGQEAAWPGQQVAAPTQASGEHGYAYAPPETKPQPADLPSFVQFDDYGRPIPGTAAANMPPGFTPPQAPPPPPPSAPPAAPPVAVGDTVVNADDADRVNAPPANPPITLLLDLRDRIQQGDISALKWLAPTPDAGPIERGARYAAMTGEHLLSSLSSIQSTS